MNTKHAQQTYTKYLLRIIIKGRSFEQCSRLALEKLHMCSLRASVNKSGQSINFSGR